MNVRPNVIYVTRPSLPPLSEYTRLLREIWKSRWLTNAGPLSQRLEAALRRYLRVPYASLTTNGTLGLQLAYRSVFGKARRIVTTPFTFAATTTALLWEKYVPVFADVDPDTFNLDPESVAECLEGGAEGVTFVQVFGNPAGVEEVAQVARRRHAGVVFDAAHSFGVRMGARSLFGFGDASVLSFHATKSFHTFEGGVAVSRRADVVRRIDRLRNFGMPREGEAPIEPGINAKMTEAQAAMGLANLRYIGRWIEARRERYERYRDLLGPAPGVGFQALAPCRYNYTYMPVTFSSQRNRDKVVRNLVARGVHPRKYFYPATNRLGFIPRSQRTTCPNAVWLAGRILALPLYPDLPLREVDRISRIVRESIR